VWPQDRRYGWQVGRRWRGWSWWVVDDKRLGVLERLTRIFGIYSCLGASQVIKVGRKHNLLGGRRSHTNLIFRSDQGKAQASKRIITGIPPRYLLS
jgi:hypothetical protein